MCCEDYEAEVDDEDDDDAEMEEEDDMSVESIGEEDDEEDDDSIMGMYCAAVSFCCIWGRFGTVKAGAPP